jgi:hypothetical protein
MKNDNALNLVQPNELPINFFICGDTLNQPPENVYPELINDKMLVGSKHDNFRLKFSIGKDTYDKKLVNFDITLSALKKILLFNQNISYENRDKIPVLSPCTYVEGSTSKAEDYCLSRHLLALDFDENPKIDVLLSKFKNVVHFAYTTHSHGTEHKHFFNRMRVIIPLAIPIDKQDWISWGKATIKNWLHSIGCVDTGPFECDPPCLTYAQQGKLPAINPEIGRCDLWFNDGNDTSIFDIYELDRVVLPPDEVVIDKHSHTFATAIDFDMILRYLAVKPHLQNINHLHRKNWAAAFQAIGASQHHFEQFDRYIKKSDSNTTTIQVWKDASKYANKHAGIIFNTLTYVEKIQCGFNNEFIEELSALDNKSTDGISRILAKDEYLCLEDYGTSKVALMCAEMNSGKNHLWVQFAESGGKVIVMTPLLNIVNQQNSDTCDVHYVYDKAKKLLEDITSGQIDKETIEGTILVIDEAHNFMTSSDYRQGALNYVEKLTQCNWKQIIFQSATVDPSDFDGFMEFDEVIKIGKVAAKRTYTRCTTDGKLFDTVILLVKREIDKGRKVLILNNHKSENKAYVEAIAKDNIMAFNVDAEVTKIDGEEAFVLANDGQYQMNDYQAIFGTYSLVEGLNIQDPLEYASVIFVGDEAPQYIMQLIGRFRKVGIQVDAFHLVNTLEVPDFDYHRMVYAQGSNRMLHIDGQLALINYDKRSPIGLKECDFISNAKRNGGLRNVTKNLAGSDKIFKDGVISSTNLYILKERYDLEKTAFMRSLDYAKSRLESMGFEWKDPEHITDIDLNESQRNAAILKAVKFNTKQSQIGIINFVKTVVSGLGPSTIMSASLINEEIEDKHLSIKSHFITYCLNNNIDCTRDTFRKFENETNAYKLELLSLANELPVTASKFLDILELCKKSKILTVKTRMQAASSKYDITNVLAAKWVVGSVLDKLELNAMLKFIIETNMGKLNQLKFDKEMRNPIYKYHVAKNLSDVYGIRFEEGQVKVNIKSPVQLLNSEWVVLESSRTGKGKNRITQYRIQSYLK